MSSRAPSVSGPRCGMTDHNRAVNHTTEESLLIGKRQVHDFAGNGFEGISFGNELGKIGFIGFSLPEFFKALAGLLHLET
ncbi:MAG: hypothetical protein P4L43_16060 [Syntrophobacteraceae bacterium]|nr:hypothetical protein [Syntrophobacteraceae bacterium]